MCVDGRMAEWSVDGRMEWSSWEMEACEVSHASVRGQSYVVANSGANEYFIWVFPIICSYIIILYGTHMRPILYLV